MNPDQQNTPPTPPNEAAAPVTTPGVFQAQPPIPVAQPDAAPAVSPVQAATQTPAISSEPAAFNPFATQVSTPLAQAGAPTTPPATPPEAQPAAPTPITTPYASTPAPVQPAMAPGTPFGDPAQPAPAAAPVAPGTNPETAKVALIMGSIGLLAWLLPIVGLPVTIIALVFAIKGLKRGQKYAKLALGFAIAGLIATLINAAVGGYIAYKATQKSTTESSRAVSETQVLNTTPYPEASRTAFVESCAANGGTQSTCTCTLNEIEKQLTFEEFSAVDKEIAETGKVPDSFREVQDNAIAACTE